MQKINYPINNDLDIFYKEYRAIFGNHFSTFISSKNFRDSRMTLEAVLTGHFDLLLQQLPVLQALGSRTGYLSAVAEYFNYDRFQPKIASFFMQYSNKLGLSTCFYCNIDHINAFENVGDYLNILDFLNHGDKEDLQSINHIGPETAERIISYRQRSPIRSISNLNVGDRVKGALQAKELEMQNAYTMTANVASTPSRPKKMLNHFTLDHIIPKAQFPLFSLSLHNFVPCCYSCNSKFKKSKPLVNNGTEGRLSPSSAAFEFDQDVRFKLFLDSKVWSDVLKEKDIALRFEYLKHPDEYRRYISLFKLAQRYVFHKSDVVNLIDQRRRYSDTRLKEIAQLINVPVDKVKMDIFGEDIFNENIRWRPLTKLKRDIARDIGIPGVAGRKP